jgi:hypothetical protein
MSETLKQLIAQAEKREQVYAQQVEQAYAQWMQLQGALAAERTGLTALRDALSQALAAADVTDNVNEGKEEGKNGTESTAQQSD